MGAGACVGGGLDMINGNTTLQGQGQGIRVYGQQGSKCKCATALRVAGCRLSVGNWLRLISSGSGIAGVASSGLKKHLLKMPTISTTTRSLPFREPPAPTPTLLPLGPCSSLPFLDRG
eukprot:scaffold30432_cov26-Tisochrysis_lutea.AAC.1